MKRAGLNPGSVPSGGQILTSALNKHKSLVCKFKTPKILLQSLLHSNKMSRIMRKPVFCICEKEDADQLRGNRKADQRLCFCYTDSTIPLLPKYKISSLSPSCVRAAWFVWDLVGNPEDRFSHNKAQMALL